MKERLPHRNLFWNYRRMSLELIGLAVFADNQGLDSLCATNIWIFQNRASQDQ